jgi:hypothetical protein
VISFNLECEDGTKKPRVIDRCPQCGCTIRAERLLKSKPEIKEERNGPTGYMPAKIQTRRILSLGP